MGFSVKTFTDRLPDEVVPRPLLLVTSRNLLEGIFTVKWMDLFDSSGFDEDRETVTDAEAGTPRVSLLDLDAMLVVCWVDALAVAARERRERLDAMLMVERKATAGIETQYAEGRDDKQDRKSSLDGRCSGGGGVQGWRK